jgi:hypothetical protein
MSHRSLATRILAASTTLGILCLAATSLAQRRFFGGFDETSGAVPYDGRFTFVRARYSPSSGGFFAGPSWSHGYPLAERNLMHIVDDISLLDAHVDEVGLMAFDDPRLFQYPIAYMIEVGWWTVTDREAAGLRNYLQKGGFLIIDDFKPENWRNLYGGGWGPFAATMKRVLPDARFFDLDPGHPVFHNFFEIPATIVDDFPQAYNEGPPVFRGIFEDNDPSKRLMVMINYNTDVSQFWEWTGTGFRAFDDTNEAYKLGVNYLMYGLTH